MIFALRSTILDRPHGRIHVSHDRLYRRLIFKWFLLEWFFDPGTLRGYHRATGVNQFDWKRPLAWCRRPQISDLLGFSGFFWKFSGFFRTDQNRTDRNRTRPGPEWHTRSKGLPAWIMEHGSWIMDQGSRIKDKDRGSRTIMFPFFSYFGPCSI